MKHMAIVVAALVAAMFFSDPAFTAECKRKWEAPRFTKGQIVHWDGSLSLFVGYVPWTDCKGNTIFGSLNKIEYGFRLDDFKRIRFLEERTKCSGSFNKKRTCLCFYAGYRKGEMLLEAHDGRTVRLNKGGFITEDCWNELDGFSIIVEHPFTQERVRKNVSFVLDSVKEIVFEGSEGQSSLKDGLLPSGLPNSEPGDLFARNLLDAEGRLSPNGEKKFDLNRVEGSALMDLFSATLDAAGFGEASVILDAGAGVVEIAVPASERDWKGVRDSVVSTVWGIAQNMMSGSLGVAAMVSEPVFKDGQLMMAVRLPVVPEAVGIRTVSDSM